MTRNAKKPGMKLTSIAARGVWPLFVRPIVFLITSKRLLFLARTNKVRLDTYNAEFLTICLSTCFDHKMSTKIDLRGRERREYEGSIEEAW